MWPGGLQEVFSIVLLLYSAYVHYFGTNFRTNLEKNIIIMVQVMKVLNESGTKVMVDFQPYNIKQIITLHFLCK